MDALPLPPQGTAILCLFDISGQTIDWYWKEVAGVPFILRNIMNIQRGGVERLLIYSNKLKDYTSNTRVISADPRVRLKLEWISESQHLAKSAKDSGDLLIFDGSALHSKIDVANALEVTDGVHKNTPFVFPLQDLTLQAILGNIDNFSLEGFEKVLRSDAEAGALAKRKRSLIFMPGTNETLIANESDLTLQNEILLETCELKDEGIKDSLSTKALSKNLIRIFLKTHLSPNLITAISFVIGLLSAYFFYQGSYWQGVCGALLLQVSAWIRLADDAVARLKFMESKVSDTLDLVCNNAVNIAVLVAIGAGQFSISGNPLYKQLGALAAMGILALFLVVWSSALKSKSQTAWPENRNQLFIEKLTARNFAYVILFMALINQLNLFILLAAGAVNILALILLYKKATPSLIPIKGDNSSGDRL